MAAWIDAHAFDGIRDAASVELLRNLVVATEPLNVYSATRVAVAAAGLVEWAHLSEGLPLRSGVLLSSQVTSMYVDHLLRTGLSAGTVRNYRGYLQRVAEAVGVIPAERLQSIPGKAVPAPYSDLEEERFGLWARTIPTEVGSARAMALLGLVAGAGLRNEELPLVQVRDVIDEAGMWVRVHGAADRLTRVRAVWAPYLRRRIQDLGRDEFVFPQGGPVGPKGIHDWRIGANSSNRPVPNRLRSTWIVAHLHADTKPESLLAWAGITRGETVANYLQFLPDATEGLRRTYMHLNRPRKGVRA
ncbi:MAG: site-specific integrase [Acidobacteria bacterium]|nr:site-specific integrase [Acidobacteriota bacterium]